MSLKMPDPQVAFRFTILDGADDFRRARLWAAEVMERWLERGIARMAHFSARQLAKAARRDY